MSNDNYEDLSGPELDAQLRVRIKARIKHQNDFYIHLIAFIGGNLLVWVIALTTGSLDFPWPLFVTIPWGMALTIHAMLVYQDSGRAVERRQQTIEREVEQEKIRLGLNTYEKPKRDSAMRLSDDGELIQEDDNALQTKAKNQ